MKRILKFSAILAIFVFGIAATQSPSTDKYFEILKNIEIFTNLYREVNTYYVDDLDPGKLMRTGIDAMMESLDPYTNYISESDIEGYRFMTEGKYSGIGAMSKKMGDYVTITELYKDNSADKAGLRPGDQIIAVDGQSAKGKKPEDVNNIMRGFPGTEVELTIRRPGEKSERKVKLVREEVNVPNVPYSGMVSDKVGYVALSTFTRDAGRNVANAFKKLKEATPDMNGLIFDLRGNGGGLLNEAVNICNIFIPKGQIVVTTKGKVKDWDRSFKTLNPSMDEKIPVVILIDKNSASASEIVSGVLQDYDRAVLLGQRSYGKGLVQNTRDIGYNSKVKMTTAKYYIPSQRCIQSVEYEEGEPVDIPDAKRAKFTTRNGRTVLDGGGIAPDMEVDPHGESAIIKSLMRQNILFDYVTDYCLKNDSIAAINDYHFEDYDDFLTFLNDRSFAYDSESEKLLKKLKKESSKEGFSLTSEIEMLEKKVQTAKEGELKKYKDDIIDLIEKEIASRYYYQIGKIKMGLRNDKEIKEAVSLFGDLDKYNKLLANTK
ncbi:MAG: S41 family peptidase [Saprospiraceae bacterium]|nr:S41 family peptidase [Saprospiraceae bacterium]